MQTVIIFEAVLYSQTTVSGNDTITINLYNSTSYNSLGTLFTTLQLNNTNTTVVRLSNFSSTINTSSFLQVQMVTANITGTYNIIFRVGIL